MNIINNTITKKVSHKSVKSGQREQVPVENGKYILQPYVAKIVGENAVDFTPTNQLKTGVKFEDNGGVFIKHSVLEQQDIINDSLDTLENIEIPQDLSDETTTQITETTESTNN